MIKHFSLSLVSLKLLSLSLCLAITISTFPLAVHYFKFLFSFLFRIQYFETTVMQLHCPRINCSLISVVQRSCRTNWIYSPIIGLTEALLLSLHVRTICQETGIGRQFFV